MVADIVMSLESIGRPQDRLAGGISFLYYNRSTIK